MLSLGKQLNSLSKPTRRNIGLRLTRKKINQLMKLQA